MPLGRSESPLWAVMTKVRDSRGVTGPGNAEDVCQTVPVEVSSAVHKNAPDQLVPL